MEWLANLSVKWVLVAVGILAVLLSVVRLAAAPERPRERTPEGAADWLIENLQVVLSVVVVVFLIIRPFLFQAFYIPSTSMEPTLHGPPTHPVGDRLLVNKLVYLLDDPERGEIAVFQAPPEASGEPKEFIKRVIGVPGETVEVIPTRFLADGRVALNLINDNSTSGVFVPEDARVSAKPDAGRAAVPVGYQRQELKILVLPDPDVDYDGVSVLVNGRPELTSQAGRIRVTTGLAEYGGDPSLDARVYSVDGDPRLIVIRGERLTLDPGHVLINGKRLQEPYLAAPPYYAFSRVTLGPDDYFVLGDNRNQSHDSHRWGPLERERFVGRAEVIFWPLHRFHIFHWGLIGILAVFFVGYQLLLRAWKS